MSLDEPEGRICRWCHEGEYKWMPNPNLRISSAEDDKLECSVCGEPPMTFEEADEARQQDSRRRLEHPES